ncbi:MAG: sterol desaturase family protein [Deltaproteobacteria bacterium]|nr:sterol desaturase family protein [Deltaproteobacteria bacterium]
MKRNLLAVASLIALTLCERRWPLRRATAPAGRRFAVNVAVGAAGFGALAVTYGLVIPRTARWAERRQIGLLRWMRVPAAVRTPLAIVLLDYTLWLWHWMNHRSATLWRFHAAHHVDVDLDASTAVRFHPGELLLSVPFRVLQILAIGVPLPALLAWESGVVFGVQFHHSNLRLPPTLERVLGWFVITPRVHGIHHSRRPRELHSNFGTLLSLWDRLHRLRVTEVDQASIRIGIPGQRAGGGVASVAETLALPFRHEPPGR